MATLLEQLKQRSRQERKPADLVNNVSKEKPKTMGAFNSLSKSKPVPVYTLGRKDDRSLGAPVQSFQKQVSVPKQFVKELPGALGQTAASIVRSIPRTAASVTASVMGNPNVFTPKSKAEKLLYGSEPITPIARKAADYELKLKDKGFGKSALPFAVGGAILPAALDLIPGGSGEKNAIKEGVEQVGKSVAKKSWGGFLGRVFNKLPKEQIASKSLAAKTQLIDRLAPIEDLVKGKVAIGKDPYVAARNYAGHFGKVQNRLDDLSKILTPARKDLDVIKEYAKLERFQELAGRGITRFEKANTINSINARKLEIETKLGPEKMAEINGAIEKLRGYNDNLLREAKEGGLIGEESYAAIKQNNQKYIPLQRLEYLEEQLDNIPRGSNSFSVPTQNIIKSIKGSEKEVADPIESIVRNTYKTVGLIERNKVAQKMGDLSKMDEFKDVIIPLNTAEKVTNKYATLSRLKDLFKENRQDVRALKVVGRDERIIGKQTQSLLERKPPADVIKLREAVNSTKKEMESFIEEARVSASEFVSEGKIEALIKRSELRERKINQLTKELDEKLVEFSKTKFAAFSGKVQVSEDIKTLKNTLQKLVSERKNSISELRGQLKQLQPASVPAGMDKFNVLRNGIKEEYAAPKEVVEALKGLNQQSTDLITSWARKSNSFLRQGATTLNLPFVFSNAMRDYQTASLVSKVGFTPADWVKGFVSAIGKGDTFKSFLESGASSGFIQTEKGLITKTAKDLSRTKGQKIIRTITNPKELLKLPFRAIEEVGNVVELAPRIGVFNRSLKKGLGSTEAAFNARNATVDFSKAGSSMRVVNMWVPFLNARIQGTVNAFGALKQNPKSALLKLSALVGLPIATTYYYNSRIHSETWNKIAEHEKRDSFIIIYGDKLDDDGNPLQVVKIPKGDIGRIFGNPLENFLSYLDKNDPKSISQLGIELLSDVSPVTLERGGKLSGQAIQSSVLPPFAKGAVEYSTNQNLYTGRQIVPDRLKDASPEEQYTNTTSPVARIFGKFTKTSPMKVENFIGTQFGGVGRQIANPKKAASMVTGKFFGARGGQEDAEIKEAAKQALRDQQDSKARLYREAEKKLEELENSNDAVSDWEKINESNPDLGKEIAKLKKRKDLNYSPLDYEIADLGVENGVRAKFLVTRFKQLQSEEEKIALWEELVKKELISKEVGKQLYEMLNE